MKSQSKSNTNKPIKNQGRTRVKAAGKEAGKAQSGAVSKKAETKSKVQIKNKNKAQDKNVFINRELSWLEFNGRVLEEACDTRNNPVLERMKFLSIVSSNLDEFFMVRVAALMDQYLAGINGKDFSGLTPEEQLMRIEEKIQVMVKEQYDCYNKSLIPALKKEKILIKKLSELDKRQEKFIEDYYFNTVYPVLTPMVVDKSRPFPLVLNKSLNIALILENDDEDEPIFGMVQVPSVLDRLIKVPSDELSNQCFVFLEDVIEKYIDKLFTGYNKFTLTQFRITRNTDQALDEEEAEDLLQAIEEYIKKRKWGIVIRLEIKKKPDPRLLEILMEEFEINDQAVYYINGPLDLTYLMKLSSISGYDNLRYPSLTPAISEELTDIEDIFDVISKKDILLHHPYDSFDPVVRLIREASEDPKVLAIKQTLYRVSGNSPIVEALINAAENGKQVTVLVELKARFDEQNNIQWAKRLEMAGCQVIYGLVGLKTHCKVLLIIRMEQDGVKRYVHFGTGNYNDVTARFYTDMGLFSSNPYFGADASALFNMLSGYSKLPNMHKLYISPTGIRAKFVNLIDNEIFNAKEGKKAHIIAKVNSLVDEGIIRKLYEASCAGVKIDLIVRGICCLKPGVEGISENISVRSIVGRYLEHSRIFYFYNDGDEKIYLASADWMTRNLDRRVELLFPVEEKDTFRRIKEIIDVYLKDNVKARLLTSSGSYTRNHGKGRKLMNSQEYLSDF
ncbi:RNA degradosome polyphosphate kinase [Pseudobacteroides cellulosolvens]|uniref:Polyphosphate kinase n=1 Tax=Pseudobacteroides cellulosolvens ATCC 35603 = DSM 2933 TaxID=398512 RepID=A0A0L6JJK1_9FIRM|nr:RNA degradosome polyphosphate kinase [Pseudobacteroides cellulosolvens]KNY25934.1 Polyphosphate kinase [Pseudobacteroides cellulosolvens ATCC 35603 = DSM 2933]